MVPLWRLGNQKSGFRICWARQEDPLHCNLQNYFGPFGSPTRRTPGDGVALGYGALDAAWAAVTAADLVPRLRRLPRRAHEEGDGPVVRLEVGLGGDVLQHRDDVRQRGPQPGEGGPCDELQWYSTTYSTVQYNYSAACAVR